MINKVICYIKGHDWDIKTNDVCQAKTCNRCNEFWEGVTWKDLSPMPECKPMKDE